MTKTPNEQAYTLIIGELYIDLNEANKTIAAFAADRDKLQKRIDTLEACGAADRGTARVVEHRFHNACAIIARALELLVTIPSGNEFYTRIEDVMKLLKQDI